MKIKSEHIRIVAGTVIIMTMLFIWFLYAGKKDTHHPPLPHEISSPPAATLRGKIKRYGSNPDKDIDKILLVSNGEERWLHFPPNTAKEVLSVAQPDAPVEVSVSDDKRRTRGDVEQKELMSVTNIETGNTFTLQHMPPPPPAEGKEVAISGNILDYIADEKGNIRSVVIDRWLISLPPHARDALMPLLVKNRRVTIKGWERNEEAGFVNEDSLTVIRPYAVVIEGTEYLIQ